MAYGRIFGFLQRSAKETALLFIGLGLLAVFLMSPRRGFYIGMVPLYYFLFQSVLHTEFRYTLPLHHFMFVFAAVGWVLIGYALWRAVTAVGARLKLYAPAS